MTISVDWATSFGSSVAIVTLLLIVLSSADSQAAGSDTPMTAEITADFKATDENPFKCDMNSTAYSDVDPAKNPANLTIIRANADKPNLVEALGVLGTELSLGSPVSMRSLETSPGAKITIKLRADSPNRKVMIHGILYDDGTSCVIQSDKKCLPSHK